MEYSKLFSTDAEHIEYVNSSLYKLPYVSYIELDGEAHYNYNIAQENNFLRFTAVSDTASICLNSNRNHTQNTVSIKYSKNGTSWYDMGTTPISLNKGETIYLMGSNPDGLYDSSDESDILNESKTEMYDVLTGISFFTMTGRLMGGGNIMSIVDTSDSNDYLVADEIPTFEDAYGYFKSFFMGNTSLLKAPEILVDAIPDFGCEGMYANCSELLSAPDISSVATVGIGGCAYMFDYCTKLLSTSELTATDLGEGSYFSMFSNCSSLKTVPSILPATTLPDDDLYHMGVYFAMFYGCKSLTTPPALPATTLGSGCYWSMFTGCSSLTTAPVLPATTMKLGCYGFMFSDCTSLTTPPALPGTTMAEECYLSMFNGCSSLTTAPALSATTMELGCYKDMFNGCSSLTTAPALPATTLAEECYSGMFRGCTLITQTPVLAVTNISTASTESCYSEMFKNCSNLNTVICLAEKNWRTYLKTSGTLPGGGISLLTGWYRVIQTKDWLEGTQRNGTIYMSANKGVWCNDGQFSLSSEADVTPAITSRGTSSIPEGWDIETYTS